MVRILRFSLSASHPGSDVARQQLSNHSSGAKQLASERSKWDAFARPMGLFLRATVKGRPAHTLTLRR